MKAIVDMPYGKDLLMSIEDMALLMEIFSRSEAVRNEYKNSGYVYTVTPIRGSGFPSVKFLTDDECEVARFLGMAEETKEG